MSQGLPLRVEAASALPQAAGETGGFESLSATASGGKGACFLGWVVGAAGLMLLQRKSGGLKNPPLKCKSATGRSIPGWDIRVVTFSL